MPPWRILSVFALPLLLVGCGIFDDVLEDDIDPLQILRQSVEHGERVARETERFRANVPTECTDDVRIIRRPVKVEPIREVEFTPLYGGNPTAPSVVGYRPIAGEWMETYAVVSCRVTRYQALHFRVLGTGSVFADVRLPGDSLVNTRGQQDTLPDVLAEARRLATAEPGLLEACPEGRIIETAVFDGPRTLEDGWDEAAYWRERWTVDWCDATIPIDVSFVLRGTGTTYTISTLSPVKYKNAKDPRASRYYAPYFGD